MKRFGIIGVLLSVFLMCCCSMDQLSPPYLITDEKVINGENPGCHSFAGAYITFFNNSGKTVKGFAVSFRLYDSDGNAFGFGFNGITTEYRGEVEPKKDVEIIVSLDSVQNVQVSEGMQLDFIYVSKIIYTDGSVWTDPVGLYAM